MPEERSEKRRQEEQEGALPCEEWFYWLQTMATAIVCILLIFTFLGRITRVIGPSMDPTLAAGELLLVWSLGYEPAAGDIVILNETTRAYTDYLHGDAIVKRVIATGGQTVELDYEAGTVRVDGQVLDEPYILETMRLPRDSSMWQTYYEVPEGCVFVMGDNRNNSTDSRHPSVGTVDKRYIIGAAKLVLFPLNKIGLL